MKVNVSILTDSAQAGIDQSVIDYQTAVAAHVGGDWGVHNQLCLYPALGYAEPVSGHTIAGAALLRVQLSGTNTSTGRGEGVYTFPVIPSGVTVPPAGIPPFILIQPVSTTVEKTSVTFTVVAASATPMTYQWLFNGVAIGGATSASYTIAKSTNTTAGGYAVIVTNLYGSTVSATAILSYQTVNAGNG